MRHPPPVAAVGSTDVVFDRWAPGEAEVPSAKGSVDGCASLISRLTTQPLGATTNIILRTSGAAAGVQTARWRPMSQDPDVSACGYCRREHLLSSPSYPRKART